MDNIFDRAHDLIDKAQEKVATATSQAAWTANQTLVIKNLEGQFNALQAEIERVTRELGERTYQAWRARADDPRIPSQCAHLGDLLNKRAQVEADLAAARAATYDPQVVQGAWQASQRGTTTVYVQQPANLPPPAPSPAIAPPVQSAPPPAVTPMPVITPAPAVAPTPQPRQPAPPVQPAPWQPLAPVQPTASQPAPAQPMPTQAKPAPVTSPVTAQEPPRPAPHARECPNCGQFVPAAAEYCPACGLRVP